MQATTSPPTTKTRLLASYPTMTHAHCPYPHPPGDLLSLVQDGDGDWCSNLGPKPLLDANCFSGDALMPLGNCVGSLVCVEVPSYCILSPSSLCLVKVCGTSGVLGYSSTILARLFLFIHVLTFFYHLGISFYFYLIHELSILIFFLSHFQYCFTYFPRIFLISYWKF